MNWPNAITVSRLLLVAPFGYLLFAGYSPVALIAIYVLAALTDWVDGALARRLGQVSARGAWLDQMVDRAFTIGIVALLLVREYLVPVALDSSTPPAAPSLLLLSSLTCARELVALPGVLVAVLRGIPLYHVEYIGKVATFVQSITLGAVILRADWALPLAIACAIVGVLSGANYLRYSLRRAGT